jgi:hypothetical protein
VGDKNPNQAPAEGDPDHKRLTAKGLLTAQLVARRSGVSGRIVSRSLRGYGRENQAGSGIGRKW